MNNIKIIKFNLFKKWKMKNDLHEKEKKNLNRNVQEGWVAVVGEGVGVCEEVGHFCLIKIYFLIFNFVGLMDSL